MRNRTTGTLLAVLLASGVVNAADVQVGVTVAGEVSPGVYGRVEIGTQPPPLVYARPIVVAPQPVVVSTPPVYLHVPPGHAKNWGKHCHKYNACSQSVYFVKSEEYSRGRGKKH